MIKIEVQSTQAVIRSQQTLTAGLRGAKVHFVFGQDWDGLIKTAVFCQGDKTVAVADIDTEVTVPWEVLTQPGLPVQIGVYGIDSEGDVALPTVWAVTQPVRPGTDPEADPSAEPTPGLWEQLQGKLESMEKAVNESSQAVRVNVMQNADGSFVADRYCDELLEAFNAGHTVSCQYGSRVFPLLLATRSQVGFGGVYGDQVYTIMIGHQSAGVVCEPLAAGDGITPHIGANGNWFIGETDTGMPSRGDKGDTGATGAAGKDGKDGSPGKDGKDYVLTDGDKQEISQLAGAENVPDYWQTHLDEKAAQIREAVLTAGRNKSAFFFYSDSHWSNDTTYTAKMAPTLLKYLCKNTPINKTNFGGDIVSAEGTDVDTMAYLWQWRKLLHGLNHHSVPGNHDDGNKTNNLFSEQYVYGYLLAPEETADIVRGDSGLYYYMDNPAEKNRYLYLDTAYQGVTDAQQAFVKSALLSTPQGWHIVAIAHLWYYNDYSSYPPVLNGFDTNAKKLLDMFDSYNARGGENDEYAACGGKVELCIGGHYHLDHAEYTDGGIPVIIVEADALHDRSGTMPSAGTIDEAAVSAVVLDYAAQQVKIIRIGRGADFTVGMGRSEVVTYYSVTNALDNVTSSNAAAKVEKGAAYTATLTATAGTITAVTVTMGGEDITASAYSEGVINIAAVTGNVVITARAEVVQTTDYNNVLLTSIGADGEIFNGGQGWAANSRIGSGQLDSYIGGGDQYITGHIEIDPTIDNTIRLRNITFKSDTGNTKHGIAFYDASFTRVYPSSGNSSNWYQPAAITQANGYAPVLEGTNIVQFTLKSGLHIDNTAVKYIAICAEYIGENSIITVNEPIE